MKCFYLETGLGCCLLMAEDAASARRTVLREVGTRHGVQVVREATQRDISWVRAMGGDVPAAMLAERAKT